MSDTPEPADLDDSIVVDPRHRTVTIESEERRFFVPFDARVHYGVDRSYLVINEHPLEYYFQILEFVCYDKNRQSRGILEVSCFGSD